MRRLVLGFVAIGILLLGFLLSRTQGPEPSRRAAKRPVDAEEPAAAPPAVAPAAAPTWRIVGHVREHDGTPVIGARVDAAPVGTAWDGEPDPAPCDESGRYEISLSDRDEGVRLYVWAGAPGYQPALNHCMIDAAPGQPFERTINFVLRRGACVAGRVVDVEGRPIGGAQVTLVTREDMLASGMSVTASDGRFSVGPVARATCRVRAEAPWYRVGWSREIAASPATDIDVGDVVVPLGRVVEGRVRYADGEPVAAAPLLSSMGRFILPRVETAADGGFQLTGLNEGQCRISILGWVGGPDPPGVSWDAGEADVLLTVPGGRIRVRLVNETGEPLRNARESLFVVGSASDAPRPTPGDVSFALQAEAVNRYGAARGVPRSSAGEVSYFAPKGTRVLLVAEAEDRLPVEMPFEFPSERNESEVVLRLPTLAPTARLRIELDAPPGTPFRARLYTSRTRRQAVILRHEGESGNAPVLGVPHGAWIVVLEAGAAIPPFFEPVEAFFEVAEGREAVLRVAAPTLGRVRLEVRADAMFMSGYKGVLIRAEDGLEIPLKEFAEPPGISWGGTLDARKPALARPLLRPGLYTVRVDLPDHERFETTIRVEGAALTDVVAEMVRSKE